ncbi:hypothetical protein O6H91_02G009600 [Diphasiastrum complanatum]|uniref:Uncharacterized protein n=1 Tax=Diphasiastrum complanatum TaxID=34168 RepID=A0ACC2ECY2_DIPCM|nr:hypothetical protein O6H91_02G009600 [Diphasiastrum complanatum]
MRHRRKPQGRNMRFARLSQRQPQGQDLDDSITDNSNRKIAVPYDTTKGGLSWPRSRPPMSAVTNGSTQTMIQSKPLATTGGSEIFFKQRMKHSEPSSAEYLQKIQFK